MTKSIFENFPKFYLKFWESFLFFFFIIHGCDEPLKITEIESELYFISNSKSEPIFSWKITNTHNEFVQEAYRIQIFDKIDNKPIWDSEKIKSKISKGVKIRNIDFKSGE